MATKIRATSSTDDRLVEECEHKTNCGDCERIITWTTPQKGQRTLPPEDTLVLVVDVGSKGAVRIYKNSDREYVDGVGTQQAGHLVFVPWDSGWYYSAAGSPRVGYITRKVEVATN